MCRTLSLLLLLPVLGLQAQVEVSTSLPYSIFLRYEGVPLRMEIVNKSGEDLVLGSEDTEDILLLRVRDLDNRVIPRTKRPVLEEPWVIPDGETSVRTFDLVQLFMMHQAMSYRCLQDVKLAGESYTGTPRMFEVVSGLEEETIKRRKADRIFTMIGLHRDGRDELMLRITDYKKTTVLATYYLERHLKHYDPFMKMNDKGIVCTLHYISPNQVVKCTFNEDGSPIARTYYKASAGVPVRLLDGVDGDFVVMGAVAMEGQSNEGE